ncbi:SPOR domain-containing protein [Phaeobacter sp. C3_T13_0]|uniref:SPOR domain-containing protein n=1 Tax=Phaeobacter cretensis TaxID=3342641 RepID=UPI0039BD2FC3
MTLTRIIASALIAVAGFGGAKAQTIRTTEPPAEFPPSSYEGKQYVDSRGCVFIRAGIDGNVTWVPRVTRSRKQLCGFEPTQVAAAPSVPRSASATTPELITLPAEPRATGIQSGAATETSTPTVIATAPPRSVTTTKPQRRAVRQVVPARVAATGRTTPRRQPVLDDAYRAPVIPSTEVVTSQGYDRCRGASALSKQYIKQTGNVRCGPQNGGVGLSTVLDPNTRVVPKHVYQERQLSRGLQVPKGYRRVWEDDRLNPRRAEMSLGTVLARANGGVPSGYARVTRQDRNNPNRGPQETGIWTRTVPQNGIRRPADRPVLTLETGQRQQAEVAPAEVNEDIFVTRLSTRSAQPDGTQVRRQSTSRYVRAATLADLTKAEAVAQRLRQRGLPVRMGRVSRNGQLLQVVLAGPFAAGDAAQSALSKVRSAGFSGARLSSK